MVQPGATNDVSLSCSSNATGMPHAFSRRKTLQVVRLASRPFSGMTSCLAPSPAVMSSLATSVTRSVLPAILWIRLVLPSATSAPGGRFAAGGVLASTAVLPLLTREAPENSPGSPGYQEHLRADLGLSTALPLTKLRRPNTWNSGARTVFCLCHVWNRPPYLR